MKKITYIGSFTVGYKRWYHRKNPKDSELIKTTNSKGRVLTDDQEEILAQCYGWHEFCDILIRKGRKLIKKI